MGSDFVVFAAYVYWFLVMQLVCNSVILICFVWVFVGEWLELLYVELWWWVECGVNCEVVVAFM